MWDTKATVRIELNATRPNWQKDLYYFNMCRRTKINLKKSYNIMCLICNILHIQKIIKHEFVSANKKKNEKKGATRKVRILLSLLLLFHTANRAQNSIWVLMYGTEPGPVKMPLMFCGYLSNFIITMSEQGFEHWPNIVHCLAALFNVVLEIDDIFFIYFFYILFFAWFLCAGSLIMSLICVLFKSQ